PDKILAQAADYAMRPEPLGPTQSMQSGFAALPEPMQRRILELFNPAGAAALPPPNATQGAAQGAAPPVANVAANNTAPAAPATPGFNPLKSSGAGSVPARMTPAQESAEADLGKEFATKESDSYEAANKAQIELGNMLNSIEVMNQHGWSRTGPYADDILGMVKSLNGVGGIIGMKPIAPDQVSSWELLNK